MQRGGRGGPMGASADMEGVLDRLVAGMTSLRHDGRFDEPNIDGTAGRLHQLRPLGMAAGPSGSTASACLWRATGDERLRAILEDWYAARLLGGAARAEREHDGADAGPVRPLGPRRATPAGRRRWRIGRARWPRTPPGRGRAGIQHDVSDRINAGELWDDTALHGRPLPRGLRRSVGPARPGRRGRAAVPRPRALSVGPPDGPVVPRLDLRGAPQLRAGAVGARQRLDRRRSRRPSRALHALRLGQVLPPRRAGQPDRRPPAAADRAGRLAHAPRRTPAPTRRRAPRPASPTP